MNEKETTNFTYVDGGTAAVLYPSDNTVTIKDFFVYCEGGVPVFSMDAKFDFKDIHPDSQAWVLNLLLSRKTRLMGATPEARARLDRESIRYKERKVEYAALPWYKRIFAKHPSIIDEENSQ